MLDYESLFFELFNKLIKTEKYTDTWLIYEDIIPCHNGVNYELGWTLIFKFYRKRYSLQIGYIPKFNLLTINDRGKCLELTPKNDKKLINCMKQLFNLFQKLSDNLLIAAIKE